VEFHAVCFANSPSAQGLDSRSNETCQGLESSVATVLGLIDKETIPRSKIMLGGFSQGAALALTVGLCSPTPLACVFALSGYLPKPQTFSPSEAGKRTPVFFGHGDSDDVVQLSWARLSYDRLKELGVTKMQFKVYRGMPHSACDEELKDLVGFLTSAFTSSSDEL
jgi:lysophospholipase-1